MSNTITDASAVAALTPGQWAIDADGNKLCLVDTHAGWPQRMWMKGGVRFFSIESVSYPIRLGDFVGGCDHAKGTNECGHCYRCGQVVAEANPLYFEPEDEAMIRAVAAANSRLGAA